MKNTLRLLGLFSLSIGSACAAQLESWYPILPPHTVGFVAVKDSRELIADWDNSDLAKMFQEEAFKKWIAPLYKDGVAAWDREIKEETGEDLHTFLSRAQGSAMFLFAARSAEEFSKKDKGAPFIVLLEAGDQEAKLEELLKKDHEETLQKNTALKKLVHDIAGVPVQVIARSEEPDAPWKEAYAFVNGVLVLGDKQELFEHLIVGLKNGTAENSPAVLDHLNQHNQLSEGQSDVMIYINTEALTKWLEDMLNGQAQSAKGQQSPVKPADMLNAFGIKEIQSIAMMMDMNESGSRMDMAILHPEKPEGLLTLFQGTSTEVPQPGFLPAGISSAQVSRQSLAQIYDNLLKMVTKLGPMAMMATMQIGGLEQQMGFKIREDLFGSLDDEFVQATDGVGLEISQVFGIKIKDRARLVGALDSLKRFIGAGFGAFEDTDYLGSQISTFKASQAAVTTPGADKPANQEIAYCVAEDYLFFSIGKQDLLKKILSKIKDPAGASIWEDEETQSVIATLPKGYFSLGVADGSRQILTIINAMTTVQKQTAARSKKSGNSGGSKGPSKGPGKNGEAEKAKDRDEAPDLEAWFDPEAQPDAAFFEKYFGTSAGGTYSQPKAVHMRMINQAKKE